MSPSSVALSNLRAFVILIVLAFHSVLAYLGSLPAAQPAFDSPPYRWQAIPIIDNERWFGFDLFCAFQDVYLMTFMFFLSGLFVWPSLRRRRSGRAFLQDRCLRLGLPFVLVVGLLMPVAHYPVYLVSAVDPSWKAFWEHWRALPMWPGGPQWFLWQLLVLNAAAAALYHFAPQLGDFLGRLAAAVSARPGRAFIGVVAASALAYVPLAAMFTPWTWEQFGPFGLQLSRPLHYTFYFFVGVAAGAYGIDRGLLDIRGALARRWALWLIVAVVGFLAWIVPMAIVMETQEQALPGLQIVADFGFVIACASACFFFVAVFLRFGPRPSRVLASLSESAYGMYLAHYVVVIWMQYLLLGLALFAITKAAIVFGVTLLLSWGLTVALCRVPVGARLMGSERRIVAKAP